MSSRRGNGFTTETQRTRRGMEEVPDDKETAGDARAAATDLRFHDKGQNGEDGAMEYWSIRLCWW
jgi:hypothetical protein